MTREGEEEAGTLRLGHIVYSNCFPVHARLIDRPRSGDPRIVEGIPSHLNELLERGAIDVAPCSSIEYARYASRYRLLPDLVIGSRGPVRSIQLLSDRPIAELDGQRVALPTASATSVVLLKILLRHRWGAVTEFFWFDQAREDPFALGAAAALFIGDVALRPDLYPAADARADLGEEWWRHTGLPFAFAVWQAASADTAALATLHATLLESRLYGRENRQALAVRYASRFGLPADMLESYWADLSFELDAPMLEGLRTFYRLAAEIGEIGAAPELRWI
ncbi:MAG: menaquinone biosynthesis protein [Gemmatimonadetes bacterium]|nr:menaquinone biosynthesis protein [Gemmatimonadota bacterium]